MVAFQGSAHGAFIACILLNRYMKQVCPDGKFIVSPSPSPKQSPNHLLDGRSVVSQYHRLEEDAGGGMKVQRGLDTNVQGTQGDTENIQSLLHVDATSCCYNNELAAEEGGGNSLTLLYLQ